MNTTLTSIACLIGLTLMGPPQRGTVKGVSVTRSGRAGQQIAVDVTGTSPCGAVNIDYGDGTAITYATERLPITKGHTYEYGGTYTIKAVGMGNCAGEATGRITISGPPRPPAAEPAGAITAVNFDPATALVRRAVKITVNGTRSCAFDISFGDGNQQRVSGALPQSVEHTYAVADEYPVVVSPIAPCSGGASRRLQVADSSRTPGSVTRVDVSPAPTRLGVRTLVVVSGTGACRVTIDFGDGENVVLSGRLPLRAYHSYSYDGTVYVSAWPEDPCDGYADLQLVVR